MTDEFSSMISGGYKQLEPIGQSGHDGPCLQDVHVESSEPSVHAAVHDDVATVQKSVLEHEKTVENDDVPNKRLKRSVSLSATARDDDSEVVGLSDDILAADSCSVDVIEQFTPVENVADPIEEFSFEAGADAVTCGNRGYANSEGTHERADLNVFCGLGHDCNWFITDDGFMSAQSESASVRGTANDELSGNTVFDHCSTQRTLQQSLQLSTPQYMWEQSGFLSTVFGHNNIVDELFPRVDLKRPACPLVDLTGDDGFEAPIQKALVKGQTKQFFLKVFRQSTIASEDTLRANFINVWTSIILLNIFAFSAFDKARTECAEHDLRATVHLTVSECLARKATSTVGKRLGSMRRFVEFCSKAALSPFPLEDKNMHAYLTHLVHDPNSSGSSGKAFLESVRFTSAMLGLRSDEINSISQRVAGLAEVLVKRAPTIDPAQALLVEQVMTLERTCCSAEPLPDKIILGGVLIMVYGSARASDMAKAVKLLVDLDPYPDRADNTSEPRGYIELGVLGQKGARSDTHRRMLLPVVAPLYSLSGTKWWESWIEARQALSLETTGLLDVPLLCRFDGDGQPVAQSMSSSEIGEFLRQVLGLETLKRNKVRSHSCKATVLSWLSKYGVDLPTRRLVGHHLDTSARSAEIYSRDSMSPAVRAVVNVLKAIKDGLFHPDDTRSGRFRAPAKDPSADEAEAASTGSYEFPFTESEHWGGDSDSTGTDSSSDASSDKQDEIDDATTLWQLLRPELRPKLVQVNDVLETFMHKRSCVVHLHKAGSSKFLCGHVLNHRYEQRELGASAECPRCTPCFSSKDAA